MTLANTLIRQELLRRGYSQKKAAAMLSISEGYLSDILTGRRSVSAYIAVRLEHHMGINAMQLMQIQTRDELARAWEEYRSNNDT